MRACFACIQKPVAAQRGLFAAGLAAALSLHPILAAQAVPEVGLAARTLLCPTGISATLSPPAVDPASGSRMVFQSGVDAAGWSGILKRFSITQDENGIPVIAGRADWDAGARLTGSEQEPPSPGPQRRNIFTSRIDAGTGLKIVPFKWESLDANQQSLLDTDPDSGTADGRGAARLDYLRGVRDLEADRPGGLFRERRSVLGDIVNSAAVFAGPPSDAVRDRLLKEDSGAGGRRLPAVYVAANDGMLHAFDAANGAELFAYVPNALFRSLNLLTAPGLRQRPQSDGAPAIGDALVSGKWKTVLVSGMAGGAQGVFALDVTDPARFGDGSAMFEFTDRDDPDMGNVTAAPAIAKFKTRVVKGVAEYRYFVVATSGYNNYKDDGSGRFDSSAPGALFLLALDKSPSEKWKLNVNYYKFILPIADATLPNGLGPAALVAGSDGAVRYAYAGDLQGNLWRLDFTGKAPWRSALGASPAQPLFVAADSAGVRQPIVMQPRVVFAPQGGYVVLFGTGKFMEESDADAANFRTQSFYGILDTTADGYRVAGRGELAQRTVVSMETPAGRDAAVAISDEPFRYGVTSADRKGWYLDFMRSDQTGEQSIAYPMLLDGNILFTTLIPGSDRCSGGTRSYVLNALTGLSGGGVNANGMLSRDGALSRPLLLETRMSLQDDGASGRSVIRKQYFVLRPTPGSPAVAPLQNPATGTGVPYVRLGWREIVNWKELHEAVSGK